jgi:hypothetical protein
MVTPELGGISVLRPESALHREARMWYRCCTNDVARGRSGSFYTVRSVASLQSGAPPVADA